MTFQIENTGFLKLKKKNHVKNAGQPDPTRNPNPFLTRLK